MGTSLKIISGVVFACSKLDPYGHQAVDNNTRNVRHPIDGHGNLAGIAFVAGLTMMGIQESIRAIVFVS